MKSCLVVGAGMCGLTAASLLQSHDWAVTVVDKGRGVGGRMATRKIGKSRFDHGAQFFTARDPRFLAMVDVWVRGGFVAPWFVEGGYIRYRVVDGMSSLAKHMASALDVRTETKVTSVQPGWRLTSEAGKTFTAETLLLTAPAPQSLALIGPYARNVPLLGRIGFDPCFALLVTLKGASRIPAPGYVRPDTGPIEWIADNSMKGISSGPAALTIHARPDFTRAFLDSSHDEVANLLLNAASPWCDSEVETWQLHRWLYSKPFPCELPSCLYSASPAPLAIAGDAFAGGRVEGAFLSGLAAADTLLKGR